MMTDNRNQRNNRRNRGDQDDNFFNEIISIRRVAKVTSGTKRLRFSVMMAVGDKSGMVGVANATGRDVQHAIGKALDKAKKSMFKVPVTEDLKTIPHQVRAKFKGAEVLVKPGIAGSGLVSGGAVRKVLDLAGVENGVSKCIGSTNPIANAQCTVKALNKFLEKRND